MGDSLFTGDAYRFESRLWIPQVGSAGLDSHKATDPHGYLARLFDKIG